MSATATRIAAIVLAAGQSRRFLGGAPGSKLVARLDGVPLVRIVATTALASRAACVIAVTGHDHAMVGAALRGLDVRLVHNADFASGMAGSLNAGLAALPAEIDGSLVLLADMPRVTRDTLDAIIARFDLGRDAIDAVVPTYRGARGNPVLIGKALFPAVARLRGDQGARQLLAAPRRIACCEVDDPGITIDVDTPAALRALDPGA